MTDQPKNQNAASEGTGESPCSADPSLCVIGVSPDRGGGENGEDTVIFANPGLLNIPTMLHDVVFFSFCPFCGRKNSLPNAQHHAERPKGAIA